MQLLFNLFSTILLLIVSISTNARLLIVNKSKVDPVYVRCTGSFPPVTIMHDYPVNLAWEAVEFILDGPKGGCLFYDDETLVATADIALNNCNQIATITEFNLYIPDQVKVIFNPPLGTPAKDISVTVIDR